MFQSLKIKSLSLIKVVQIQVYSMYFLNMHTGLLSCPPFPPFFTITSSSGGNSVQCYLPSYLPTFLSLKHTRPLFKSDFLFLLLGCNCSSSVCRPSVFLAHLLLLSENITTLLLVLHSFAGCRKMREHFFGGPQYFKCPIFLILRP